MNYDNWDLELDTVRECIATKWTPRNRIDS